MKRRILTPAFVIIFLIGLSIVQNTALLAQSVISDSLKSFRLFEDDTLLKISLQFDLTTYFRTKPRYDYLKANITFHLSNTDSIAKEIKLKTRGVFRNKFCLFAPIELNFKKADFGYADLDKMSKIKLVVQCSSGKDQEEYVLREYLTYKLFNVLSDTSYRVRLLSVNYIDSEKKRKPIKQFGFFIEPADLLANRTNCLQVKSKTMDQRSIVPEIMDRLAIFNYMIGNYDWAVPGEHNVLVLKSLNSDPNDLAIAIPHDFDWTGLVNASYAIPSESIGIGNVRERIYEGICRKKEVYNKELDLFLKKKGDFYRVINGCTYINKKAKRDMTGYLDEFFDQLNGPRNILLNSLFNTCKHL
jgi:hypothetical protein